MKKSLFFVGMFIFMLIQVMLVVNMAQADTVTLTWINPTTYADNSTMSTTDAAALQTVLEAKPSTSTTWTEIGTTINAAILYKWTVTDIYVRGSSIDFRAKSRLVKNNTNYDSDYCTPVTWVYPYLKPGKPTSYTVTLNLTNATSATISITTKK